MKSVRSMPVMAKLSSNRPSLTSAQAGVVVGGGGGGLAGASTASSSSLVPSTSSSLVNPSSVLNKKKAQMIRSRSMLHPPSTGSHSRSDEESMKQLIRSVPFFAYPGMGSQLNTFQRSVSKQQLSSMSTSVSTTSSAIHSPKTVIEEREEAQTESERLQPELTETSLLLPGLFTPPTYTSALVLAVFTSVLSSFQVGLNSGILNVPESVIRHQLRLSELQWSLVVSIFCIGGLFGSVLGGRLADRIGRKNLLTSTNVLFISGALLESLAQNFSMLLIGRLTIGLGCGCSTVIVPLYLGEIAPANLRGSLGTMIQFSIVIGILVANLLGKPLARDETADWRYLLGISLLPSLLQLVLSAFLLESPLWLVVQRGNKELASAEQVLISLRGHSDVDFELELFKQSKQDSTREAQTSFMSLFLTSKTVRKSLLIGLSLQVAQQFSGINAVFYYSTAFFAKARVSDPWLGSVLASTINFVATALAIPLMDRTGRRVLLLISSVGMMVSCWGLTFALYASTMDEASVWLSTLSVVGVLLYVCFFEVGLGPIPWLIGAEIYPASIRAMGMSLSAIVNWSSNFIISLTFPHMNNYLTCFTFLPFSLILLITTVFVLLIVPETRDLSLEEIQIILGGGEDKALIDNSTMETIEGEEEEEDGDKVRHAADYTGEEASEADDSDLGSESQLMTGYSIAYSENWSEGEDSNSGASTPSSASAAQSQSHNPHTHTGRLQSSSSFGATNSSHTSTGKQKAGREAGRDGALSR